MKPRQQKKTLFMGQVFAFPMDENILFHMLMDEFGSFHQASRSTSWCNFSYPHGLFEEDMEESDEAFHLAKTCATQLQQEGFASFAHCHVLESSS